jgi:molybdopterin synthase catalytic subunit
MIRSAIVTSAIDVTALITEVTSAATGASTVFLGTVREVNEGRGVSGIEYTAYAAMAAEELERIAHEAALRFDGVNVAIEHRVGTLEIWKREHYTDGDWQWVNPTAQHADAVTS